MSVRLFTSFLAIAAVLVPAAVLPSAGASAQRERIELVRDAEIENAIRTMSRPIFQAAGLDAGAIEVHLVQDRKINAFVAGGQRIFINTGLIMRTESANQLLGVLAHEAGHIRGGHLAILQEQMRNATALAVLEMILAAGAAGAGGSINRSGQGTGAGGNVPGQPGAPYALKQLLAYNRAQEQAADQAGVTALERAGMSPRGMVEVMRMLQQQERIYVGSGADPYLRSHPSSSERIAFLEEMVSRSRTANVPDPPAFKEMHARMVAKTLGYFEPARALQKYPSGDNSVAGRYGRAMALFRMGQAAAAVAMADQLIRENPRDPYFHEFRGDVLRDSGRPGEAVASYAQAVALSPGDAALRFGLAQAQSGAGRHADAAKTLEQVVRVEPTNGGAWDLLARTYAALGNQPMTDLATAEKFYLEGPEKRSAALHKADAAARALPRGSPAWQRATDLRAAIEADRPSRR